MIAEWKRSGRLGIGRRTSNATSMSGAVGIAQHQLKTRPRPPGTLRTFKVHTECRVARARTGIDVSSLYADLEVVPEKKGEWRDGEIVAIILVLNAKMK